MKRSAIVLALLALTGCGPDLPVGPIVCGAPDTTRTTDGAVVITQFCMGPGR